MLKLWRRVKLANLSVHKFRESRRPEGGTTRAAEVMAAARRINRKLRGFEVERHRRPANGRSWCACLRRTRKRVDQLLAAIVALKPLTLRPILRRRRRRGSIERVEDEVPPLALHVASRSRRRAREIRSGAAPELDAALRRT